MIVYQSKVNYNINSLTFYYINLYVQINGQAIVYNSNKKTPHRGVKYTHCVVGITDDLSKLLFELAV